MCSMLHLKVQISFVKIFEQDFLFFIRIEWREEEVAKINATKQGAGIFE